MIRQAGNRRTAATVLVTILALSAAAPGALAQPADRATTGPLGSVSMPREADGTATAAVDIAADVGLEVTVARDANARWILVSVGSDVNSNLVVQPGSLAAADGSVVPVERVENDGTARVNWWLDVADLPDALNFTVAATVDVNGVTTDVETLVMAFGSGYQELAGPDGEPLLVQSFTTVKAAGSGNEGLQGTNDNGTVDDDTLGNDTLGNDTDGNDTLGNDTDEEEAQETPFPGALLMLAAIAGAAVVLSRRRK